MLRRQLYTQPQYMKLVLGVVRVTQTDDSVQANVSDSISMEVFPTYKT
jgi:hypothetical protein